MDAKTTPGGVATMDSPAQKEQRPKDVLRGTYVGHLPEQPGNYVCFDVMTREEYICKVFKGPEERLQVLSGKDHQVHNLSDFDHPNVRWITIEPLGREGIDRYLGTFS